MYFTLRLIIIFGRHKSTPLSRFVMIIDIIYFYFRKKLIQEIRVLKGHDSVLYKKV